MISNSHFPRQGNFLMSCSKQGDEIWMQKPSGKWDSVEMNNHVTFLRFISQLVPDVPLHLKKKNALRNSHKIKRFISLLPVYFQRHINIHDSIHRALYMLTPCGVALGKQRSKVAIQLFLKKYYLLQQRDNTLVDPLCFFFPD